jgi:hypothetical protein
MRSSVPPRASVMALSWQQFVGAISLFCGKICP